MRTRRKPASTRRVDDPEARVSSYFTGYVDQDRHLFSYAATRPIRTLAVLVDIYRLSCYRIMLSDHFEGRVIRSFLTQPRLVRWSPIHALTAVLKLPQDPASYSVGSSRQTLRRKVRAARKLGVDWAEVEDPNERMRLLSLAHDCERRHPMPRYRESEPDNNDLLDYRMWLAAYAADGRPLLLSVTPVDGDWALLRYFRTLGVGPEESNARYLMTQVLVERLIHRGVKYLAEVSSPVGLPNGLRHYQRMLGFRIARVRPAVTSTPRGLRGTTAVRTGASERGPVR